MKGTFQKRAESYIKKDAESQKAHGVVRNHELVFPLHQKTPIRGIVALWLLKNCRAQVLDAVRDVKKGKKNGNS